MRIMMQIVKVYKLIMIFSCFALCSVSPLIAQEKSEFQDRESSDKKELRKQLKKELRLDRKQVKAIKEIQVELKQLNKDVQRLDRRIQSAKTDSQKVALKTKKKRLEKN